MNAWRFMIATLVFLSSANGVSYGKDNNFSIAFNCGEDSRFDLCITKELPRGTNGVVFDLNRDYTCNVKVLDSLEYGPIEPAPISRLDYKKCRDFRKHNSGRTDYIFYHGGPVSKYSVTKPKSIDDKALIDKVDQLIRGGQFLPKDFEEYFGGTLSKKPIVYAPVPSLKGILLVQYVTSDPFKAGERYGPMYTYIGGKVKKLDDEAAIEAIFNLNGRFFVLYFHGCWGGCGNLYSTLIEITQDGIIEIFSDGFFAT